MTGNGATRILLTGGTGFFGKSILSMRQRGRTPETDLSILARTPEAFRGAFPSLVSGVTFYPGDVRGFAFPDAEFDAVIHAAAPARTGLPPGEMRSIILEGTRRVLGFARERRVKKLLFVSSGAVYGPLDFAAGPVAEDRPCRPTDEYGKAKLEAERMCLDSGMDAVIARCFAFTGPYLARNIHFAIGNFIGDALAKRPITIRGDGSPVRSYLYADDLVDWLFALLFRGEPGEAYNVGSARAVTLAELARLVTRELNPGGEVRVLNQDAGPGRSYYVPDVSLAERRCGVSASVPLAEAIRRSAAKA